MSFFGSRRQTDLVPQPPAEKPQPPRPATPTSIVGFETVLGASSTIEGVLRSSANVRIDGTFTGTLEINGNILVGETARINADINARNISIAGAVRGNVSGKKVQLLRTGRIWGDIRATALTTEEGAFIDGKITMVSQEAAAPAQLEAPPAAGSAEPVTDEQLIPAPAESSVASVADEVEVESGVDVPDSESADESDRPEQA